MNLKNKKFLGYAIGAIAILLIIAGVWANENKKAQAKITADLVDSYFSEGILGVKFDSLAREYGKMLEFSERSSKRDYVFYYKSRDELNFLMRFNKDTHELASERAFMFEGKTPDSATFQAYSEFYLFADALGAISLIQNNFGKPTRTKKKDKTTILEWRGVKTTLGLTIITDRNLGMENACIVLVITQLKEEENNE